MEPTNPEAVKDMNSDLGKISNRSRIIEIVSLMPGLHLREIQRILGISFGSTRHNVRSLARSGKIVPHPDGGFVRLYPAGTNELDMAIYPYLRNRTSKTILSILLKEPGLTNKEISERARLAKSTVSEYLATFLHVGIAKCSVSVGERATYRVQDANRLLQLLVNTEQNSRGPDVTERFVDLWDF
jgi:predicted transcriptional regulator